MKFYLIKIVYFFFIKGFMILEILVRSKNMYFLGKFFFKYGIC